MKKTNILIALAVVAMLSSCKKSMSSQEIYDKTSSGVVLILNYFYYSVTLPDDTEIFFHKKSKTTPENTPVILKEAYERLKALPVWDSVSVHDCLIDMAKEKELKNGTVMWPVRIAAAGKTVTPGGAIEILEILGRDETLRRMELGMEKLG